MVGMANVPLTTTIYHYPLINHVCRTFPHQYFIIFFTCLQKWLGQSTVGHGMIFTCYVIAVQTLEMA